MPFRADEGEKIVINLSMIDNYGYFRPLGDTPNFAAKLGDPDLCLGCTRHLSSPGEKGTKNTKAQDTKTQMSFFKKNSFIRNVESGPLLESFLVAAIASLLAIRFFLHVTGYPQLGGGRFHIAHMLWGGLFMLAAMTLLLAFLGRPIKSIAAIIGGVGFGAFIDELGKYITRSNDYFFRPTVAIIYIIFILLFLAFRRFQQHQKLSREETIINVLDLIKEGVINDLDTEEKAQAITLLNDLPANDPLANQARAMLETVGTIQAPPPNWYRKTTAYLRSHFLTFADHKWFVTIIVAIILFQSVFKVVYNFTIAKQPVILISIAILSAIIIISLIQAKHNNTTKFRIGFYILLLLLLGFVFENFLDNFRNPFLSFYEWGEVIASTASALLVVYGALKIKASRFSGFRMIERALLISIFITQFFTFYRAQLNALLGLVINIIILAILQYLIQKEKHNNPI